MRETDPRHRGRCRVRDADPKTEGNRRDRNRDKEERELERGPESQRGRKES